jgi:hypothetical protein
MARTPNAQGRQQELGAAPGDFSGKLPGWSQGLTPKQLAAAKLYANSSKPPGDKGNPYVPASLDEYNKLGGGAWLVDDDGKLIQKPGAAPAVRR